MKLAFQEMHLGSKFFKYLLTSHRIIAKFIFQNNDFYFFVLLKVE